MMKEFDFVEFKLLEKDESINIIDGDRGVNYPKKTEMTERGFCLFLNTGNIKNDVFDLTQCDYVSQEKDLKLRKGKLKKGDIILTTRGTVGSVAYYHPKIKIDNIRINSGMVILRCTDKLQREFVYHILKSSFLKEQFYLFSSGSAQPQLPIKDLRRIRIPLPPLPIQRKIAAILSAYDELIENNNRRIAILEKMAEEIYHEWFVRLRFPGHENVKIIKGVPEGWEVTELRIIAKEVSKSTRPGEHLSDRFYIPIDLFGQKKFTPINKEPYNNAQSSLVLFEKGDILFGAMRPYLHKVNIAPSRGVTRTTSFVIRPIEESYYSYLYLLLFQSSTIEHATQICNGADRPYVVWKNGLERMKVFKPMKNIADEFNRICKPIFKEILYINEKGRILKSTRDLLLPRLISGKLDVENLDIVFPPGMKKELEKVHG